MDIEEIRRTEMFLCHLSENNKDSYVFFSPSLLLSPRAVGLLVVDITCFVVSILLVVGSVGRAGTEK